MICFVRLISFFFVDALVQNFFNNVNYHYYILYPPIFLQEYQSWWEKRAQNRPLSLQWTCLLLMVCACACQHLPIDMQEKLELEMSETAQQLTEKYHDTARELASVVPVGYYHIYNVQWLLHSTYWYKAEARFLECWHVLGAAAREAQELGNDTILDMALYPISISLVSHISGRSPQEL